MAKQPDSWHQHVLSNVLPRMEQATSLQPGPANPQPFSVGMHLQPLQHDPLELLPPAAAERLRLLRQRAADAHAVVPAFEDIREASTARSKPRLR
jgi:hypothetical protein